MSDGQREYYGVDREPLSEMAAIEDIAALEADIADLRPNDLYEIRVEVLRDLIAAWREKGLTVRPAPRTPTCRP